MPEGVTTKLIMAQYEHLPIYRKAFDLTVYFEKIVRNFSRYHKYCLGTELRQLSHEVVRQIVRANNVFSKPDWRGEIVLT